MNNGSTPKSTKIGQNFGEDIFYERSLKNFGQTGSNFDEDTFLCFQHYNVIWQKTESFSGAYLRRSFRSLSPT